MCQRMLDYVLTDGDFMSLQNQFAFSDLCLPFIYMFNLETAEDEEIIRRLTLFLGYATNYFLDELVISKRTINVTRE